MAKKNPKICIINRGLAGCGKSYTASVLVDSYGVPAEGHIFSTDDFFIPETLAEKKKLEVSGGLIDNEFFKEFEKAEYVANWSGSKLRAAHSWNFKRFTAAIRDESTPIIVDNTNLAVWEMKPYALYAVAFGYEVKIQEPTSPWWQDHAHMMLDKQKYGKELEDFARFLCGFHEGMTKKYGANGNQHGIPLDAIRRCIRKWQPNVTVREICQN